MSSATPLPKHLASTVGLERERRGVDFSSEQRPIIGTSKVQVSGFPDAANGCPTKELKLCPLAGTHSEFYGPMLSCCQFREAKPLRKVWRCGEHRTPAGTQKRTLTRLLLLNTLQFTHILQRNQSDTSDGSEMQRCFFWYKSLTLIPIVRRTACA